MRPPAACQALEVIISAYVDGESTAEETRAVQEHTRTCSHCAALLASEGRFAPWLAGEVRAVADAAAGGAARTRARQLAVPVRSARVRSAPRVVASLATALLGVTLLLVVFLGLGALLRAQRDGNQPATGGSTLAESAAPNGSFVLYATGTLDPSRPGGLQALEMPSGQTLGRFADVRRQGGGFAVARNGQRGYLLDGPYFSELDLPSMRQLRTVELPNPINVLGWRRVVAVSPDGREVYVETTRIIGPTRWDPVLYVGQPDSEYGIAIYDIAQGAFTREIALDPPWCGVAELYSLADGQLAVVCSMAREVRLVDPTAGRQTGSIGGLYGYDSAASPDGQRLWVVVSTGQVQEIDLAQLVVTRTANLAGDPLRCAPSCVPGQRLHVTADGTRLFVRAAPEQPELRSRGLATVVWVVDTATLKVVAEVPLPAPAFDAAPTPDGRAVITSNTLNTQGPTERATRLVEIPTGRELVRWSGGVNLLRTQPPASSPSTTSPGQPATFARAAQCTAAVVGRVTWGYADRRPAVGEWVQLSNMPDDAAGVVKRAATGPDGGFRVEGIPIGQHDGFVSHARFAFTVEECGQTVDVGTVEYPLVHPPVVVIEPGRQPTYPVFIPTDLPTGMVAEPPVIADEMHAPGVTIVYRAPSGSAALKVFNGPPGCCLDVDPSKGGEPAPLPNALTAHFLPNQPDVDDPILWWVQDGTYVALSGPLLSRDDLVNMAASVVRATVAPFAKGTPIPSPTMATP